MNMIKVFMENGGVTKTVLINTDKIILVEEVNSNTIKVILEGDNPVFIYTYLSKFQKLLEE